ncbi:unnamed protein product [Protopolystoma xenopodis]|uniref:Uncharacterized protein n=1 Tax=Protopolystoma xenopodis TaxID=117903 RepID=A0A3S5ADN4_9PLAT|nr:unnamed protein product [Protopolystoma xenopodis]
MSDLDIPLTNIPSVSEGPGLLTPNFRVSSQLPSPQNLYDYPEAAIRHLIQKRSQSDIYKSQISNRYSLPAYEETMYQQSEGSEPHRRKVSSVSRLVCSSKPTLACGQTSGGILDVLHIQSHSGSPSASVVSDPLSRDKLPVGYEESKPNNATGKNLLVSRSDPSSSEAAISAPNFVDGIWRQMSRLCIRPRRARNSTDLFEDRYVASAGKEEESRRQKAFQSSGLAHMRWPKSQPVLPSFVEAGIATSGRCKVTPFEGARRKAAVETEKEVVLMGNASGSESQKGVQILEPPKVTGKGWRSESGCSRVIEYEEASQALMALSPEQILNLRESWQVVKRQIERIGVVMFLQ